MISIKSKTEIDFMKRSGEIVATALEKIGEAIKPGVTTVNWIGLLKRLSKKMVQMPSFKGDKGLPGAIDFPASICASVNDEVVHGIPGLKMLKDGDIISVDIGAYLNGYHGDAARTFPVGNIAAECAEN